MKRYFLYTSVAVFALLGCGQNNVAEVRVTESAPAATAAPPAEAAASSADRFGFSSAAAPVGAAASGPNFTWTKPEAWTAAPATQFRPANFTAGPENKVEAYLTVLPGGGGGIEANLNRWRTQMQQEPYTAEEIQALEKVPVLGQEAILADIGGTFQGMSGDQANENYRTLGAIFTHEGATITVKMVGPSDAVEAERTNFIAFVQSLQPAEPAGEMPPGHPPVEGGAATGELPPGHPPIEGTGETASPGGELPPGHPPIEGQMGGVAPAAHAQLDWDVPSGWEREEDRPVRLVTFSAGENTECYVTVLPGDAGGLAPNANLWRQQLGQAEIGEAEMQQFEKIQILGTEASVVEASGRYADMAGELHEGYKLLGAIALLGDRTLFVKMVGPEAEVEGQRDNFFSFCQSLRMPADA